MNRLELRELLEEKTGTLLLVAGGFLIIQIVAPAFPDFAGFASGERLPGWAGFIFAAVHPGVVGRVLPFIALLGLYHRLTSETPRLAVMGGTLMALTPILYLTGLLTLLLRPVPEFPYLLWLSPLAYMVGTAFFGLAFLWKDGSIRFVGIPLLLFSGRWTLLYAVGLKTGEVPGWFPSGELLAVSVVTMGYLLYTDSATRDNGTLAGS
ncbi:hypothetical protein M0R89_18825 (plasmid) [Halorussus limi]|uniref:Uncharacterized protein n=1 Tax=Halorussus limi TaxID=2938695 RepID=A0A8U0I080_9EURY|nr:hypothetical protein [Halorussus limi]UPV76588.1 hypothetical protein M0R89_18825 [Halorussus limi]